MTVDGGHLGPVWFETARGRVQPFAVAPWGEEALSETTEPLLRKLRGDFFCFPFGSSTKRYRGLLDPPHGETASCRWTHPKIETSISQLEFSARLQLKLRPGWVRKRIRLRRDETNLYCCHEIHGVTGRMCFGHHAMLRSPTDVEQGLLALSSWKHGQVCPVQFENPETGGYSSLKSGARFSDLRRVPRADGTYADLSRFPARPGFDDLVMVSTRQHSRFAWTAVTFTDAGYLWFSLKNPSVLRSTVIWCSNGGRHYAPWNGRHRGIVGLEDVTAYFHLGLAASARPNPISRRGIPTWRRFTPQTPFAVNYIMGVVAVPKHFARVVKVLPRANGIVFLDQAGRSVEHPVQLDFIDRRESGQA